MNKVSSILFVLPMLLGFLAGPRRSGASSFYKDESIYKIEPRKESNLINAQTRVIEYCSSLDIVSLKGQVDVLKFQIDKDINVLNEKGEIVEDFASFYQKSVKGNLLPCLDISNNEIARNYLAYVDKRAFIKDAYLYSDSIAILKAFSHHDLLKNNYFVFDISQCDLESEETVDNLIQVGNSLGVNIFALDSHCRNFEEMTERFSKRQKTLWGTNVNDKFYINRAISSGADGCVFSNFTDYGDEYRKYARTGSSKTQYIAAHRGAVNGEVNENSLDSVARAASLNADYVEIDLQITKDRKIMACHNDLLSVTTDCPNSATFLDKTASEIKEYDLIDNGVSLHKKIPLLSEIFEANKDNRLMFLLEFKFDQGFRTAKWDVAQYVNDVVKQYRMENRVLGITFFSSYYESMKKHMGYMPILYLGLEGSNSQHRKMSDLSGLLRYLKRYGVSFDYSYTTLDETYILDYVSRGYLVSAWTFKDVLNLQKGLNIATSDAVDLQSMLVRKIPVKRFYRLSQSEIYEEVSKEVELYNGLREKRNVKLMILEGDKNSDKHLTALYYYYDETNGYGLYSDVFTINVIENGGEETDPHEQEYLRGKNLFNLTYAEIEKIKNLDEPSSSVGYLILTIAASSILLAGTAIAIVLFLKKKKISKN